MVGPLVRFVGPQVRLVGALLLVALAACDGRAPARESQHERALAAVERLTFVPAANCYFTDLSPPLVCANAAPLLVDRYEVRRSEWKRWHAAETEPDPLLAAEIARWPEETDDFPAAFMTLDEARRFAASRGMRLLSAREWLRIAVGTRLLVWPWGQNREAVSNNLELGLERLVAVGTFEQGQNPLGVYDLLGNAWEWVEEPISLPYTWDVPGLAWALGGSYLTHKVRLYRAEGEVNPDTGRVSAILRWRFASQSLDPRSRSTDVGLRCAIEADQYLTVHAPLWGADESAQRRLVALGASWGRNAVPLLESLCARPDAGPALGWLLEGAERGELR